MAEEFLNPLAGYSDLPEGVQKVSLLTSGVAGIASGLIKIPKGIASLAAELIDLGADTKLATDVEQFFDGINPFEEVANQRLSGRLTEALTQIGVPSVAGAKAATKIAEKALKAKRTGAYANLANPNLAKGVAKADELNKLSTTQRFGAIAAGGAAGETLVADVEKLGTIGSAFGIGPTQLDDFELESGSEDAARKLMADTGGAAAAALASRRSLATRKSSRTSARLTWFIASPILRVPKSLRRPTFEIARRRTSAATSASPVLRSRSSLCAAADLVWASLPPGVADGI